MIRQATFMSWCRGSGLAAATACTLLETRGTPRLCCSVRRDLPGAAPLLGHRRACMQTLMSAWHDAAHLAVRPRPLISNISQVFPTWQVQQAGVPALYAHHGPEVGPGTEIRSGATETAELPTVS